jgi:beta-glucosidase
MSAYQAIQGVPATAHAWLLRDVLKNEWGFDGMVLTDWNNVGYMVGTQQIASSFEEAALLTVSSGNDMVMSTPQFYTGSLSALESKQLDMKDVDDAVRRVLEAKFKLGLFEDPRWPDIERASERIGQPFSRAQALLAAEESLVLLKNNGILPLNESQLQSIAIVGPNADHALQMSGDWSLGSGQWNNEEKHPRNCTVTVLDGFRERFPGEIRYEPGAFIEPQEPEVSHNAAIDEVSNSNVSIVVVGDRPSLYGERKSTATLELRGTQKKFLKAVASTNRPFILVVISSKPLVIDAAIRDKAAAIIWQFCPGMLGGRATARAVFGDYSPSGRLPITIPKHVGQLPVFYQQVRGQHGWTYADLTQAPAYAFGFGLTYTTIEYISAATDKWVYKMDEDIIVTVKLLNSGTWSAVEVVQVYVSDVVTSATWVDQELKGFKRVLIEAGDTIDVDIVVKVEDLSIVNADNERVVEPGEFQFRVGKAANDIKHYLHVQVIE